MPLLRKDSPTRKAVRSFSTLFLVSILGFISQLGVTDVLAQDGEGLPPSPIRSFVFDPPPLEIQDTSLISARELGGMDEAELGNPANRARLDAVKKLNPFLYEQILGTSRFRTLQEHHAKKNSTGYYVGVHVPLSTLNFYMGQAIFNFAKCAGSGRRHLGGFIGTDGIFGQGDPTICEAFYESLKDWRTWVGFSAFVEASRIFSGLSSRVAQNLMARGAALAATRAGGEVALSRLVGNAAVKAGWAFNILGAQYMGLAVGSLASDLWHEVTGHPLMERYLLELRKGDYKKASLYLDGVYRNTFGDPEWLGNKEVDIFGLLGGAFLSKWVRPLVKLPFSGLIQGSEWSLAKLAGEEKEAQGIRRVYQWSKEGLKSLLRVTASAGRLVKDSIALTEEAGGHGRVTGTYGKIRPIKGWQRVIFHAGVDLVIFFTVTEWVSHQLAPLKEEELMKRTDRAIQDMDQVMARVRQEPNSQLLMPVMAEAISNVERRLDQVRSGFMGKTQEVVGRYTKAAQDFGHVENSHQHYIHWIGVNHAKFDSVHWTTNVDPNTGDHWHCENYESASCQKEILDYVKAFYCGPTPKEAVIPPKLLFGAFPLPTTTPLPSFLYLDSFWPDWIAQYDGKMRVKPFRIATDNEGLCGEQFERMSPRLDPSLQVQLPAGFKWETYFQSTGEGETEGTLSQKRLAYAQAGRFGFNNEKYTGVGANEVPSEVSAAAVAIASAAAPIHINALTEYHRMMRVRLYQSMYGQEVKWGEEVGDVLPIGKVKSIQVGSREYVQGVLPLYDQEIMMWTEAYMSIEGARFDANTKKKSIRTSLGKLLFEAAQRATVKKDAALNFATYYGADVSNEEAQKEATAPQGSELFEKHTERDVLKFLSEIPTEDETYVQDIVREWEDRILVLKRS